MKSVVMGYSTRQLPRRHSEEGSTPNQKDKSNGCAYSYDDRSKSQITYRVKTSCSHSHRALQQCHCRLIVLTGFLECVATTALITGELIDQCVESRSISYDIACVLCLSLSIERCFLSNKLPCCSRSICGFETQQISVSDGFLYGSCCISLIISLPWLIGCFSDYN